MCLAVPVRVEKVEGDTATVELGGNRYEVCTVMTPEVQPGDWVLVHAGYAITRLDPAEAAETFEIIARTQQRSSEQQEATDA